MSGLYRWVNFAGCTADRQELRDKITPRTGYWNASERALTSELLDFLCPAQSNVSIHTFLQLQYEIIESIFQGI